MRPIYYLHLLLVIGWALSGCAPTSSTTIPTKATTQNYSPTFVQPTVTPIVIPIETATLTPPATLKPEQAQETMRTLLQEPVHCLAPCFWGITPKQSTLGEAKNIFISLGLEINSTAFQGKDFYGVAYDFNNGLSILITLTVQDEIVTDLRVDTNPETQKIGVEREWLAYSPETLIKTYSSPSEVNLIMDTGPNPSYSIIMYFDTVDLIIEYHSYDLYSNLRICPLTDQIDSVRIWMGKNPQYPPSYGIPFEEATTITMEEFSNLMTGDSDKACFTLNRNAFP